MIRIAIIEDDDDMMRIVSKCVKESSMGVADLDICCLTNAEDFLDKAKQEEFDILFSDIELPGMNGIELGKMVREKYPELYLVYLTSHSEFAAESYTIEATNTY
ncbi:MAG: LytR/AlgR family response regulator transcription factor [[Clostridium] scindens]